MINALQIDGPIGAVDLDGTRRGLFRDHFREEILTETGGSRCGLNYLLTQITKDENIFGSLIYNNMSICFLSKTFSQKNAFRLKTLKSSVKPSLAAFFHTNFLSL